MSPVAVLVSLLVAGCGGKAVIDALPADAGTGGAGGAAASGSVGPSTSASTGAGGSDAPCSSNEDCAASEFCDFPGDASCGGEGTCSPRPEACPADCPAICGCDGQVYCNACVAQGMGVDMAGEGPCVVYGAAYQAGFVDEMVLWRRGLAPPSCSVIRFWTGAPTPGLDVAIPPPWSATAAVASSEPTDCATPFATVGTPATQAEGGVALAFDGPGLTIPCGLVFEAELTFEPPLPPSIEFEPSEVEVVDGCF